MWKAHRGTSLRPSGTRPTGLQSRRCAMHSGTHTRVASKSKSVIANGSFGCGSATMKIFKKVVAFGVTRAADPRAWPGWVRRRVDRSSENDASSSATRKSLFLTSKSETLARKSLFLTSKSEMLTRKSLLLTSKSEMLTSKSLLLTGKSEMLARKSLFLIGKVKRNKKT